MWKDPIVEETRSRREELVRRFNYDIKATGEALRRQQMGSGQKADHSLTEACSNYCGITRRSSRRR